MFEIRQVTDDDEAWIEELLVRRWTSILQVTWGQVHDASKVPAYVATGDGQRVGLITYRIDGASCEIVTLDSVLENQGVGTALVEAVRAAATSAGCTRLWLITTNDNLHALRFWQKRGFRLVAVHRDVVAESRRLKPSIPLVGRDGIPIRDELELEATL